MGDSKRPIRIVSRFIRNVESEEKKLANMFVGVQFIHHLKSIMVFSCVPLLSAIYNLPLKELGCKTSSGIITLQYLFSKATRD
jgi:hypothetical protein